MCFKFLFLFILIYLYKFNFKTRNHIAQLNLQIALCTMGKGENLYSKEFIDYYFKLGINHIPF